jgi:hypothetical protein
LLWLFYLAKTLETTDKKERKIDLSDKTHEANEVCRVATYLARGSPPNKKFLFRELPPASNLPNNQTMPI